VTAAPTTRPDGDARPRAVVGPGHAWFDGVRARGVVECVDLLDDAARVAQGGFWVVVGDFDGPVRAWRFGEVSWDVGTTGGAGGGGDAPATAGDGWVGPDPAAWSSSMGPEEYRAGVRQIRHRIRDGDVYQANLCRVLSAPLPARGGVEPDAAALAARLRVGNPAPYAGGIHVPGGSAAPPVWVVSASPELFLRVRDGVIFSGPIKGTAREPGGLADKDRAENVMIADLVRNDLQQVCDPGTVEVTDLLAVQHHPGLVHLVTTVQGRLRTSDASDWAAILRATYPPASVAGAPTQAALSVIRDLERQPRGPYCGAVGWIDAQAGRAELAVAIRTFWWTPEDGGQLRFGTGAGITWGSDPEQEWAETELKASRLVGLAGTAS
jgi:para-aminobenzoate synthetase component 1